LENAKSCIHKFVRVVEMKVVPYTCGEDCVFFDKNVCLVDEKELYMHKYPERKTSNKQLSLFF
jgi:hypothetical protein